ncbi:efflux RND transporter periplasmic adaptor subunit [Phormidium sp. LEGE 05292]|uniref:efflux RND transporter periplasmic adaptor subunit n=1 Tax=[Phormidium] sp. LEGE 05292 TaxID=767427 RepID=UPI001881745F|nr:efflux RND transporter periplasmic adaptor subunit [Phormidium sp. LEGE 05292]MBE9229122.1 efflux RND transporter periplasmic adaptor subunit [Phormidium sp. LEGE 05292]
MIRAFTNSQRFAITHCLSGILLSLILLNVPLIKPASSQQDSDDAPRPNAVTEPQTAQSSDTIKVDANAAQQMGIHVEPVTRQRLAINIKTTGLIEALPDQKVAVTAPILGTVVQLLAKPGDAVKAGQVVARLSSPELAELRVEATSKREEAQAGVQQAQADLKLAQQNYSRQQQQAIADLKEAQTGVALAQERYDRNKELQTAGAITRRQLQESEAALVATRATLTKAQSKLGVLEAANQLSRAQTGVTLAQSRLSLSDSAYRTRLKQLKTTANNDGLVSVTAPISGIVADRPITPGETITVEAGSKPLMTIINAQKVWATANLYEKDLPKVKLGQSVQITVTSLADRVFTGRVAQIGTVVEGTRVVPVKVELDNFQQLLKPGMFAQIEIMTERTPDAVLVVPNTAILLTQRFANADNNGTAKVFLQQGEGYRPVEVSLGQTSGNLVEVKSGLKEGDRIVTEGTTLLYAQSLGGAGIPTDDDDDKPEADKKSEHDMDDVIRNMQIPAWIALPIGVMIAGAAFWLGLRTARKQSTTQKEENSNPDIDSNLDLPLDFDGIPFAKFPRRKIKGSKTGGQRSRGAEGQRSRGAEEQRSKKTL